MRWLVWGAVGLLVACGGGNGGGGGGTGGSVPRCVPGDSKSCAGPGACVGYQVCGGDGTYGACICGTDGAAGTGDADAAADGGADAVTDAFLCVPDAGLFADEALNVAETICAWERMCGWDAAACDLAEQQRSLMSSWASNCHLCPGPIVPERLAGICLGAINDTPCSSMHGLTVVVQVDCAITTLCYRDTSLDAGGN